MFHLKTTGYAAMIAELEQALDWLQGQGIATETKRHTVYLRHLRLINKRWEEDGEMRAADVPIEPKRMETALIEASLLIRIWRAFRSAAPEGLSRKLRIFAGGPELERDEKPKKSGNSARDAGFELDVAAHLSGIGSVDLTGGVDVMVRFHTMPLFVECKRPSSRKMIGRRLDEASDAIISQLSRTGLASYGIPAISVAKADWKGGAVIEGQSIQQIQRALTSWVARLDEEHISPWFARQSDGRVVAVLVHIPYVGYVRDSPSIAGLELRGIMRRFLGAAAQGDLARFADRLFAQRRRLD